MKPNEKVKAKLDKLAEHLLDAASAADPEMAVDIFKAVSNFYVGATRVAGKEKPEEDGPTFGQFREKIAATTTKQ